MDIYGTINYENVRQSFHAHLNIFQATIIAITQKYSPAISRPNFEGSL